MKVHAEFVRGEMPVPALCSRPTEVAIHRKYMYKVTSNIKTFKNLKCTRTLLLITSVWSKNRSAFLYRDAIQNKSRVWVFFLKIV